MLTAIEPRKCRTCGKPYIPWSTTQAVCSHRCAERDVTRARKAAAKAERQRTKARREAIKTKPQLLREAQREFNAYIRERDRLAGFACISSNRPLDWSGNAVDAGHYRSVGSAPHLRFNELNCHAQSKHDNQYKAGAAVDYRIGLVARIGLAAVEALEADQSTPHWTHDDLRAIATKYRAMRKALEKERA